METKGPIRKRKPGQSGMHQALPTTSHPELTKHMKTFATHLENLNDVQSKCRYNMLNSGLTYW